MNDTSLPIDPAERQRRRRLWIGACAAVVAAGLVASVLAARHLANQKQLRERRDVALGIVDTRNGDLRGAIEDLNRYLQRNPQDVEALAGLATAYRAVTPATRSDLVEAARAFDRLLQADPLRDAERRELVTLLDLLGDSESVVKYIDLLIDAAPSDGMLHRLRTLHLLRLNRAKEAEISARAWSEAAPSDASAQLVYAGVLRAAGKDQLEPDSFINTKLRGTPPLARVARAVLFAETNQPRQAAQEIDAILAGGTVEPALVRPMVAVLDRLDRRADADRLLAAAKGTSVPTTLVHLVALRELDRGNSRAALAQLAQQPPLADGLDRATQLGLTAFLARRAGQGEAWKTSVEALRALPQEVAAAWLAILQATAPEPLSESRARELLPQLRLSVRCEDVQPLLQLATANCLAAIGQARMADRLLVETLGAPSGWSVASRRLVEMRRARGEYVQAIEAAQFSFNRSGRTIDSAIQLALAVADTKPTGTRAAGHLQLLREIQRAVPGEVQTLGLYIAAIASSDRTAAAKILSDALARGSAIPLPFLLEWAELSQQLNLGLEAACLELAQASHGLTPRIAYARALIEHRAGQSDAALAALRTARAEHPADERAYDEAIANFLLLTRSPDAAAAWIALAARHPQDVGLQVRVLELGFGGAGAQQRELIDRIRKADPNNVAAELADVRLAVEQDQTRSALENAILRLNRLVERSPDLVAARLLLVDLLAKTNNEPAALAQWEKAYSQVSDDVSLLLAGARLMIANGDRPRATELLERLSRFDANLTGSQREETARTFLALGVPARAVTMLDALPDRTPDGDLVLAEALFRTGQEARASALLDRLLQTPSLDTLLFAAAVADARGQRDMADAYLQRAQGLANLSELDRLRVVRFASGRGGAERVIDFVAGANVSSEVTIQIARTWVEQGEINAAFKLLNDAAGRSASSESIRVRLRLEQDLRALAALGLYGVAAQLIETPDDSGTKQMVQFALTTQDQTLREQQQSLDRLAALDRDSYALQMYLAERYLAANQPTAAERHARAAARVRPASPVPMALAALAMSRAGNTGQCLEAVRDWRARLPADDIQPDALEARTLAERKEFTELLARFEPKLAASGRVSADVVFAVAEAMFARGRETDAIALLEPVIASDSRLASAWFARAATSLPANAAWACLEKFRPVVEQRQQPAERVEFAIASDQVARRSRDTVRLDTARQRINAAERSASDLPLETVLRLVENRTAWKEWSDAERLLRAAIPPRLDATLLEERLSRVLLAQGRRGEALEAVDRALARAPQTAAFHDLRAAILQELNRPDDAMAAANTAQQLERLNPRWQLRVAMLQQARGDLVTARAALDTLRWFFREPGSWDKELMQQFRAFEDGFTRRPTTAPTS